MIIHKNDVAKNKNAEKVSSDLFFQIKPVMINTRMPAISTSSGTKNNMLVRIESKSEFRLVITVYELSSID